MKNLWLWDATLCFLLVLFFFKSPKSLKVYYIDLKIWFKSKQKAAPQSNKHKCVEDFLSVQKFILDQTSGPD